MLCKVFFPRPKPEPKDEIVLCLPQMLQHDRQEINRVLSEICHLERPIFAVASAPVKRVSRNKRTQSKQNGG